MNTTASGMASRATAAAIKQESCEIADLQKAVKCLTSFLQSQAQSNAGGQGCWESYAPQEPAMTSAARAIAGAPGNMTGYPMNHNYNYCEGPDHFMSCCPHVDEDIKAGKVYHDENSRI